MYVHVHDILYYIKIDNYNPYLITNIFEPVIIINKSFIIQKEIKCYVYYMCTCTCCTLMRGSIKCRQGFISHKPQCVNIANVDFGKGRSCCLSRSVNVFYVR